MTALVATETAVLVLLVVVVTGLARSHSALSRRLAALEGGRPVRGDEATLSGTGLGGEAFSVQLAGANQPWVLAFLSSGCTTCAVFWRALADNRETIGRAHVVIVTRGPATERRSEIARLAPAGVDVVMTDEAWGRFRVPGSPYFVVIDGPSGDVLAEGTATSWDEVASMITSTVSAQAPARPESATERAARIHAELTAAGIEPPRRDPR